MNTPETDYPCVGVCLVDADTGYCLGCGRPPAATPVDETTTTVIAPRVTESEASVTSTEALTTRAG